MCHEGELVLLHRVRKFVYAVFTTGAGARCGSSDDWADHPSDEMPPGSVIMMFSRLAIFASACTSLPDSIDERLYDESSHTLYSADRQSMTVGIAVFALKI